MERSNRNLWIGLGILALLALMLSSWGGGGMMIGRGVGIGAGPFGVRPFVGAPWLLGLFGIGLLLRVLFFGGLIFLIVRFFRGRGYHQTWYDDGYPRSTDLPPEEILRRRYAAGEISREQYEEMRHTVQAPSA